MVNIVPDKVHIARYLAVCEYRNKYSNATLSDACSKVNIPLSSYYKGKDILGAQGRPTKQVDTACYIDLKEPTFYLGSWFIPGLTYPITPIARS